MPDELPDIYPGLRYRDAAAAVDWLCDAFGFERHEVHADDDGAVVHAELRFGNGMVMLGAERPTDAARWLGGRAGGGWAYVVVRDADAHYARARAAGAEIVSELTDQEYGSRDYTARDPEGNLWSFGTYEPSLAEPHAPPGA
jgi:uncharacterized glyoxalase superfamily protein PhnB